MLPIGRWLVRTVLLFGPEARFDTEFIDGLNETAHVVTQNLTKDFVDAPHFRLTAEPFTELALNHAERRLDIGAAVVVIIPLEILADDKLELPAELPAKTMHS